MFNLNNHEKFLELISPISDVKFEFGKIDIAFSKSKKELADLLKIKSEKIVDTLRLLPTKDQIIVFKNLEEFKKFTDLDSYNNLLVIDDNKFYSFIDNLTYIDFKEEKEFYLFDNAKSYLSFVKFLKSLLSTDSKEFHFIDSFNVDFRRIVMINFSEKGRLNITYDQGVPSFDSSIDYNLGFEKFKSCFLPEHKSLPKFLKSEIIKFGQSIDENVRLKKIFESLGQITERANINFEVYLNEVSVEKLKKDYDELKTKYFKELSETLGKITQKLIGLPIGVSASLIAIDRVSGSPQFLYLLLAVIVSTSIILSVLINSNLKDLNYLKKIFILDYKFLAENKFFEKRSSELDLFLEIKNTFMDKLSFYFIMSHILFFVMNIANVFVILFIFRALQANESAIYVILGILIALIIWYWIKKMEKSSKYL